MYYRATVASHTKDFQEIQSLLKNSLTEINDDIVPHAENRFSCPLATFFNFIKIDWTFTGNVFFLEIQKLKHSLQLLNPDKTKRLWPHVCLVCVYSIWDLGRSMCGQIVEPRHDGAVKSSDGRSACWCFQFHFCTFSGPLSTSVSAKEMQETRKEKGHKRAQCLLLRHTNRLTLWIKDYSVWFDSAVLFNDTIKALAAASVFQYTSGNRHTPAM